MYTKKKVSHHTKMCIRDRDWYLRVYIDKEGGVTIDDCQAVSRAFNEILDKENYITDQYIFEVSSPGLTRPLKKERCV